MPSPLPPPIAAFFAAHNSGRTDGLPDLFTGDARVADEQREHRGAAIREWLDGRSVVTARVSGNFSGSPARLRCAFTLRNGRIAALAIGA